MAGASPLPTLEGERFQSRICGKRDGISSFIDFDVILEHVVIWVGDVVWSGWVFDDKGAIGLLIEGQSWGELDLQKGYVLFEIARSL
jgi:hypothetical protein